MNICNTIKKAGINKFISILTLILAVSSLVLFIPFIQDIIITVAETLLGRSLTRHIWHEKITGWETQFFITSISLFILLTSFYFLEARIKENIFSIKYIAVCFFIFLMILNFLFPTQSDDIGRSIGGIKAAISSYLNWNGRFGELLLVSFGSWLSTTFIFPFINAFVGTSVFFMLFFIIFGRKPENTFLDTTLLILMLFFFLYKSAFGAIFFWAAGSFNYLWAYFFIFAWIIPYRIFYKNIFTESSQELSSINVIFFSGLSLIAGWFSEFGIVYLTILFLVTLFCVIVKKTKLPLWYICGFIFFAIGWIFVYKCPGAQKRALLFEDYHSLSSILAMPFATKISLLSTCFYNIDKSIYQLDLLIISLLIFCTSIKAKFKNKIIAAVEIIVLLSLMIFKCLPLVVLILLICICLLNGYLSKTVKTRIVFCSAAFILFIEFIFTAALIQKTCVPKRAASQYTVLSFMLIALLLNYIFHDCSAKLKKFTLYATFIICTLYSIFVAKECFAMNKKWNDMTASVEMQKQQGLEDIVVDESTFNSKWKNYCDWENPGRDPYVWPNNSYASYFGVKTFKTEKSAE